MLYSKDTIGATVTIVFIFIKHFLKLSIQCVDNQAVYYRDLIIGHYYKSKIKRIVIGMKELFVLYLIWLAEYRVNKNQKYRKCGKGKSENVYSFAYTYLYCFYKPWTAGLPSWSGLARYA